ncbi:MAG: hypothetical protein PHX20_07280 [Candidatus Omnitrophica bacterium]|nr:hypothetical protein [Candidatus Omnitrophota bacterium]MDD5437328.1 hypothetical protein [Candidatus Omnitrophota bacterium]
MRKTFVLVSAIMLMTGFGYASDYQGVEEQGSIFQKLGDLITGRYEVEKGKTLKEKGVVQVMAEQVKEIKSGPVR